MVQGRVGRRVTSFWEPGRQVGRWREKGKEGQAGRRTENWGSAAEMERDAHDRMRDSPQLPAPVGDLHHPDAFLSASAADASMLLSHEASRWLVRAADRGAELPAPRATAALCREWLGGMLPCRGGWLFLAGRGCLWDPLGFPTRTVHLRQLLREHSNGLNDRSI